MIINWGSNFLWFSIGGCFASVIWYIYFNQKLNELINLLERKKDV